MTNVSIVVPVFNGEETIEKCLKSLLDLNYPKNKLEIIVVDNNSQDKTPKIVRKFPVRFLFESIQSSFAARNKGIKNAKYEIIAFTDADCVAHKNWVKELIKKFKDSEVMGVSGKILAYEKKTLTQKFTDDIIRKIWDTRTGLKWFEGANVAYRKKV
jgi:glycosyltransferase involved in cell wall biosynthesis